MSAPLLQPAAIDDAEQLKARVAWYYFMGGMTQQEIANRLGLTRIRVNRIVGQLRADGSVRIEVRLPLAACVALEERLRHRFGLMAVSVVPTVPDDADLQRVIGEAAAALLEPHLADGRGIAVGWGRTLRAAIARIAPRRLDGSWVVSLMGGLARGSGTNTFEVSTALAQALGAECFYFTAPIYCPSRESKATLLTHYGVAETMRRAQSADVALVTCGDLSPRSLLGRTQAVVESTAALRAAGAVGDLLGVFCNALGEPVDHPLNDRVMALNPKDLKCLPVSIMAAGGPHKAPVMRGLLQAGYVNRLATDETTALALLEPAS
ncbi:MAG: sugar-binding transcriptional regulator [Geminicoccaceae bacterium]|nr:MAG: sugar-binding transcriptional regulator [Geminicoccaceae bacterium]